MAEYLIRSDTITSLANAIRNLNNTTNSLSLSEMISNINASISREDGILDQSIDSIENNRIVSIRQYGFYQNTALKTVSFPLVKNIGDYAFYKCLNLSSVDMTSVEKIGAFCFKGCSSLLSANYPLATSIGQGVFDECINLSSVNLPLLQTIQPLTFRKCKALTSVDFTNVTSIGTQAFYDSGITSLTLRSNTVVTLENEDALYFTPIDEGTGYIYVPSDLVDSYKAVDEWSAYANQIRAIV